VAEIRAHHHHQQQQLHPFMISAAFLAIMLMLCYCTVAIITEL